nr:MAG TPA: hypothetical protein [Microviridae sp.]
MATDFPNSTPNPIIVNIFCYVHFRAFQAFYLIT